VNPFADEPDDDDVPEMALAALAEAQRRALASGRPVVLVRDGRLVRIQGDTVTVLRTMPPRKTVGNGEPRP
jgi:hypothetical protein